MFLCRDWLRAVLRVGYCARKHIPDDQQKLEFKIRLKYKLNEKYQQLMTKSPEAKSNMLVALIEKEAGPIMDKVNELIELDAQERELFLKYRAGFNGNRPIDDKFFKYFQARVCTHIVH